MKIWTIIICSLLVSIHGYSQTPQVDSLLQELRKYTKPDSLRAQLLMDIAIKLRRVNPTESKKYYEESYQVAVQANEPTIEAKANNGVAICYGMLGEYPMAIETFNRTIALGKKYNDFLRIADGYNGLGIIYRRLGDYPQSLEYYVQALATYDSIHDQMGLGAAHENVGVLYDLMKQPDKAMEYYQLAIQIYTKENKPILINTAKTNIGVLYLAQKKYDDALALFRNSLRIYDSLQRHANAIEAATNIGHVYVLQNKYKEAQEILMKYLLLAKELEMKEEQAFIFSNLFEIAMATNNLDLALLQAQEHKRLAELLDAKELKASTYSILSRVYEKRGEYSKSLAAYKEHKAWSDSVFNEDNARKFKSQEVKVEVLEKNKQLAEQDLRLEFLQEKVYQETRMKWLLAAASALLLATGILFFQKFRERKRVNELLSIKNAEISRQKVHIEAMNYQLENRMLRAQINPHFIFNSLSSIQHFVTSDDKPSTLKYLSKFSHLLRQVLESSITGNVVMKEELKLLSMYLELEALRFDNTFSYAIHVDQSIDPDMFEIPTMILQPLIENAVLHGLLPKKDNRKLLISFVLGADSLEVKVEDNGIGRKASAVLQEGKRTASPSRGLSVTEQRLASLREKHGWDAELVYVDLYDENGHAAGTCVKLNLPLLEII
jgi:tetratricopeptide (TPR) repeat protein